MGTSCTTGEQTKKQKAALTPLQAENPENPEPNAQKLDPPHTRAVAPSLQYPSINEIVPSNYYTENNSATQKTDLINTKNSALRNEQIQHSAVIRQTQLPVSAYQPVIISEEIVSNSGTFLNASKKQESKIIKESQKEEEGSKNGIQIQSNIRSNQKKIEQQEIKDEKQKADSQIPKQFQETYSFNIKTPNNQALNPSQSNLRKTSAISHLNQDKSLNQSGIKQSGIKHLAPQNHDLQTTINIKTSESVMKSKHPNHLESSHGSRFNEDQVPVDSVIGYGPAGTHQYDFQVNLVHS